MSTVPYNQDQELEKLPPLPTLIKELTQILTKVTIESLQHLAVKNSLGRLRRQRDKKLLGDITLEVEGTLKRLTTLGWSEREIAPYIVALIDNYYEAVLARNIKDAWEADTVKDDGWEYIFKTNFVKTNLPRLWDVLKETILPPK